MWRDRRASVRRGVLWILLMGLVLLSAGVARAGSLTRGVTDDVWFDGGPVWTQRTVAAEAKTVLLEVDWSGIEPSPPAYGEAPLSPSDPHYDFGYLDPVVRQLSAAGISVALLVTDAPAWAEAPGGPSSQEAEGAYKPDPHDLGQFATALARRYSGHFADPANPGHMLPRVRYFQAWAEANFDVHLAPQWVRSGGRVVPFAPFWYRRMLNSFYAGIKAADRSDVVITTGFGPYGDSPGICPASGAGSGCRTPPVQFLRTLLCLNGRALHRARCSGPAHYDALAIDPYEVGSPTTHAANTDDVSAPDLGKLTKVQSVALKSGRALPRARKQLWVTEFSYDSNPPNPGGVSLTTQARWLEQSLYLFWNQGVSTAVWYLVRDQTAGYNPLEYYSGIYFYGGAPKPSLEAYRFPLVVMPTGHRQNVWGISPRSGRLTVQHQQGRHWRTLFTTRVHNGAVFVRRFSRSLRGNFRATVGGETSLIWHR